MNNMIKEPQAVSIIMSYDMTGDMVEPNNPSPQKYIAETKLL